MVGELTPREYLAEQARGDPVLLLDVREPWEREIAAVPVAHVHIPMGEVPNRLAELNPQVKTVVICRSGGRSLQVAHFLEARGFESVYNLAGGILAWSREVDPRIPEY
jgi:rhodanese-related sulfurtransferase